MHWLGDRIDDGLNWVWDGITNVGQAVEDVVVDSYNWIVDTWESLNEFDLGQALSDFGEMINPFNWDLNPFNWGD